MREDRRIIFNLFADIGEQVIALPTTAVGRSMSLRGFSGLQRPRIVDPGPNAIVDEGATIRVDSNATDPVHLVVFVPSTNEYYVVAVFIRVDGHYLAHLRLPDGVGSGQDIFVQAILSSQAALEVGHTIRTLPRNSTHSSKAVPLRII